MAVLKAKTRKALPASDFGLPGQRAYPMPDKAHAANAKARATQQEEAGNLSPAQRAQIDAKANKKLDKTEKQPERHPQSHAEFEKLGR